MPTLSSRLLLLLAVALTGQALAQAPVLRPQWSVTFDEASPLLSASWTRPAGSAAEVDAPGRSSVAVDAAVEAGACGSDPRRVSPDAASRETARRAACNQTGQKRVIGISSTAADGVLVNLAYNSDAVGADGRRTWQYQVCEFCTESDNWNIAAQHLLPGGGAWLLAYEHRSPPQTRPLQLLRIGADGAVLVRTPADSVISGDAFYAVIVPDGDDVVLLGPTTQGLEWARFSAAGTLLGQRSWQWLAPLPTATLRQWQRWSDGGISLLTYHRDYSGCNFSPSVCPPAEQYLLRLAPDGSLLWRYHAATRLAALYAGFEPDGTTVLLFGPEDSSALQLRQVDADGVAGPMVSVSGSENVYIGQEAGPVQGRYLVVASQQLLLLDRSGSVLQRVPAGRLGAGLARGTAGFLVASLDSDAVLLSADNLATLVSFDVDGQPGVTPLGVDPYWQMHDDGSVYTAASRADDGLVRPRVSRFAIPGTTAADLIFIARFD